MPRGKKKATLPGTAHQFISNLPKRREPSVAERRFYEESARPEIVPAEQAKVFYNALPHDVYKTKLFGLHALKSAIARVPEHFHATILPFRTYSNPNDFSIRHFAGKEKTLSGRLIVRSDPVSRNETQTIEEWVSMPRMNLYLERQNPNESERIVREWMAKAKQKFPGIQFIVHKVRNLADYDKSVQLNFDLPANRIIVSSTEAGTDRFREERTKQMVVSFDHRDRLRIDSGAKETLPDGLINPAFACIRALAEYATMQGHPVFEASFVTYREAPGQPEFYDLIFGKRM